jgi:2-hydroxychromene-2-carboxylate isomerase
MPHLIDLFWSFRSPYSYLATPRLMALAEEYSVEFRVRPVYPLAVRIKGFFKQANPLWLPYLARDTYRVSQQYGVPFGPPRPDPIVMNMTTGDVAEEQPYIYRLTQLGQAAAELGRGLPFLNEVSQIIWSGKVQGWNEGDHLAHAAQRAGLDLARLDAIAAQDKERLHGGIEENQKALNAAGHWGVPTMAFDGEAFFGQDRIDALVWRLKQRGLKHRDNRPVSKEFLMGGWRLDRWELWRDGAFQKLPLGERGSGHLQYGADGRMTGFLQHQDWPKASVTDRPTPDDFLSYAGTWRLDGGNVIHHVEHASIGSWVGAEVMRAAKRTSTDGLELIVPDTKDSKGRTLSNILRWTRA